MNEDEFEVLLSNGINPFSYDYSFFKWFITRGKNGVSVIFNGKRFDYKVREVISADDISFSGAGDAFASGVIYALESGFRLKEAIDLGYEMFLKKLENKAAGVIHVDLAEIAEALDIDILTGCFNRNAFERVKNFLRGFTHVLVIDIDFFKKVNDTYGHSYGDEILKKVASLIKSSIRKNDRVYRYGGEEFVVFLFDITYPLALEIAKRINSVVRERTTVTVTIGVSKIIDSIENSIIKADMALYEGKKSGRDRVIVLT